VYILTIGLLCISGLNSHIHIGGLYDKYNVYSQTAVADPGIKKGSDMWVAIANKHHDVLYIHFGTNMFIKHIMLCDNYYNPVIEYEIW
jgi:hypothetical protein